MRKNEAHTNIFLKIASLAALIVLMVSMILFIQPTSFSIILVFHVLVFIFINTLSMLFLKKSVSSILSLGATGLLLLRAVEMLTVLNTITLTALCIVLLHLALQQTNTSEQSNTNMSEKFVD